MSNDPTWTDAEVRVGADAVERFGFDGDRNDAIDLAQYVIVEVAPAIAARAVSNLMDDLMNMDGAGEFGECCTNPDCRACTVLQTIATRVAEGSPDA